MAEVLTDEDMAALDARNGVPDPAPGAVLSDEDVARLEGSGAAAPDSRWGQSLLNGLTFGLRPRIQAAIETGAVSGPEYEAAKKEQWRKDDAYARANPITDFALTMAGSLPTVFIPGLGAGRMAQAVAQGGNVAQNLTRGQRLARLAGVGRNVGTVGHEAGVMGAKMSAVAGAAGSREDDVTGRLAEGGAYAPLGYAGGRAFNAIFGPQVRVAEELYDANRVGSNAQAGAIMALRRGLERDGTSTDAIRQAVLPNMGRRAANPQAVEDGLIAYGDALTGGATEAAAQTAGRGAYRAAMRAEGSTLADRTLDDHMTAAFRGYEAQRTVPLAIDEAAKISGSRGQNLHWTRRAAANSPGAGREQMFDSVIDRQENILPTVRQFVTQRLDDPDFLESKANLIAQNRNTENQLYGIARANEKPFDLFPALENAYRTMPFRGGEARSMMDEAMQIMRGNPLPDGSFERHTLDTYIQARGQLNDLIERSMQVNPATGAQRATTATRHLMDLKTQMDDIVSTANPRWRWANGIARGGRSAEQAMDDASRMTLGGTDKHTMQVARRVSGMRDDIDRLSAIKSPTMEETAELNLLNSQLDAYRMGFARVLHKALNSMGDTHDVSKLFLKGGRDATSGPRAVLRTMLGDEEAGQFLDMMRRGQIASGTFRTYGNSQTTPLRDAIDELNNETRISGMMRALGYVTDPRAMLRDVGDVISSRLAADRNTALANYYSRMTDDPAQFFRMLRDIDAQQFNRGQFFAGDGLNAYMGPGMAGGAFGVARVQDQERRR